MKNNLKILFIQFGVLAFGSLICEYFFNIPKWLGFVISGLMFFLVFFIIQIKSAQNNKEKEVSSDGIAGARMCGIFISAILQAFILGIYIYQIVNIVMVIIGIILLTIERKKMGSFFFENRWENKFWYIYLGWNFIICGVFSIFACLDIAPCTEFEGTYRIVGIIVWFLIIMSTLPPNTLLARFATNNFKMYEERYRD